MLTTETVTSYIPGDDITIVWQKLYLNGVCIQRSITGWYYGEPNEECTHEYRYSTLNAQFF